MIWNDPLSLLPLVAASSPERGSFLHYRKLCTLAGNFTAMSKAPSQRELAKPSGFD